MESEFRGPSHNPQGFRRIPLDGSGWTLSWTDPETAKARTVDATVPGNVELDLQRAGILEDPYPPDRVDAMRALERVDDWTYERSFDMPATDNDETVRLVLEGVDTIADVVLNGERVLDCRNMFIPHAVDVTSRLRPTGNELQIRIHSPELCARRFEYSASQASRENRQAEAYLRKARHMWGWDNAPRLLSAGLWRPVYLETLPPVRFRDVYLYTQRVSEQSVWIGCNWAFETPDVDLSRYRGILRLSRRGEIMHEFLFDVDFTAGRLRRCVPRDSVQLWWPRGYGEPVLYDASLELLRGDDVLAAWRGRFGIREIELVMTDTTNSSGDGEFVFVCNGERIYINGTNWKPLDALHSRSSAHVPIALEMCRDLNCNMVRVWGGGVYEDHEFFDICDETGLLVWQDFMFACEFPPRDSAFQQRVKTEAEAVVRRLRNHPSLAVWCGDNEVDATFGWDSATLVPKGLLPSHNLISRRVLRNAVLDQDPYRSYVPSSPYVSDSIAGERRLPPDQRSDLAPPEAHVYPGNEQFREAFRRAAAHFIGETGPFFINAMSQSADIVARELPRARRLWDAPVPAGGYTIERHQTDEHFVTWKDATRKRLRHLFGRDFDLEPWDELAFASNILCAEIFKFAIEYSRSRKWRKTGVLWWSLADMWPMMFNYSVVDHNLKPKQPCYDWIRQSQKRLCLMAVETEDGDMVEVFAANDTRRARAGSYCLTRHHVDGTRADDPPSEFAVEPNCSVRLDSLPTGGAPELWVLRWQSDQGDGANHYVCGSPPYDFEVYRAWCHLLEAEYR